METDLRFCSARAADPTLTNTRHVGDEARASRVGSCDNRRVVMGEARFVPPARLDPPHLAANVRTPPRIRWV